MRMRGDRRIGQRRGQQQNAGQDAPAYPEQAVERQHIEHCAGSQHGDDEADRPPQAMRL